VSVLVFVRAAENFELANPSNLPTLSPFTVQSDEYVPGTQGVVDMSRYRINFGEAVKSLRPLLRRTVACDTQYTPTAATGNYNWRFFSFRYPKTYGYDTSAPGTAKGLLLPGNTYQFNFTPMNTFSMVSNCFIGQRGAIMWHLVPDTTKPLSNLRVTRRCMESRVTLSQPSVQNLTATFSSLNSVISQYTSAGTSVVNCSTTNGLSVSIPNYTQYKFQSTRPNCGTRALSGLDDTDGSEYESWSVDFTGIQTDIPSETVKIHTYFGVGTDYSLIFFLNVPTMYCLNANPLPS